MAFTYAGRYGEDNFVGRDGRPLPAGTPVAIMLPSTNTHATLYSDRVRSSILPNPTQLGQDGNLSFYAEPGDYDLLFVGSEPITVEAAPDVRDVGTGTPGASGGSYVHDQASPSTTWTIDHNLGYYPNVQSFDTNGVELLGGTKSHSSLIQTVITWAVAVSGKSYVS